MPMKEVHHPRLALIDAFRNSAHPARAEGMSNSRGKSTLLPFDAARYLTNDTAITEYITAVVETGDTDLLLLALGDVAHARGLTQVAKDAEFSRESFTRHLRPAPRRASTKP